MKYTNEMTFSELKKFVSDKFKNTSAIIKVISPDYGDGKVTTVINVSFKDGSSIEFYDYKATNKYSKSLPSVTKFKQSKYAWHVKASNEILLALV